MLPLRVVEPRLATPDELEMVHTPEYVGLIRRYASSPLGRDGDYRFVGPSTPIASNTFDLASLATGAVFTAIDEVIAARARNAAVVCRPPDHHAYPARGEGFCIFNHTALGARYLQRVHGTERVMILDWDVHHGNGTQAIFNADPTVFTFSIHSYGVIYPRSGAATDRGAATGQGYTMNVPIEPRAGDGAYLRVLDAALRRVTFRPDFLLIVAGFDAHRDDPLGDLRLSDDAFDAMTSLVADWAEERCGGRLVSVVAGGYNLDTVGRLVVRHLEGLLAASSP